MEWRTGALLVPIQAAVAERMYIQSLNIAIPYPIDQQAQLWQQYFAGDTNVTAGGKFAARRLFHKTFVIAAVIITIAGCAVIGGW